MYHHYEIRVGLSESAIISDPRRHLAEKSIWRHFRYTYIANNSKTELDTAKLTINLK